MCVVAPLSFQPTHTHKPAFNSLPQHKLFKCARIYTTNCYSSIVLHGGSLRTLWISKAIYYAGHAPSGAHIILLRHIITDTCNVACLFACSSEYIYALCRTLIENTKKQTCCLVAAGGAPYVVQVQEPLCGAPAEVREPYGFAQNG